MSNEQPPPEMETDNDPELAEDRDDLAGLDDLDDLDDLGSRDDLDEMAGFEGSSTALFAGDDGCLDLAQRQALVIIIKKRFVTAASDAKVWKTLTTNPQILRSRLNDLFMDLHLDTEREIAFKRQVAPEAGGSFPTLLYDTPWGREDTILLVFLRARLRNEQAAGNARVYVDRLDMLEAIESHRPASATDHAADHKRAVKAIENLSKAGLLMGSATGERFEVSPAIEVMLPVEKLSELLTWLQEENDPNAHLSLDAQPELDVVATTVSATTAPDPTSTTTAQPPAADDRDVSDTWGGHL